MDWEAFGRLREPVAVPRGAMIYAQDEWADRFYYLLSGRVAIFLSSPGGLEKTLTVREPGSVFGEAAFFDGMPRMSSARAVEDCLLVPVDEDALLEAFRREPRLAAQMLRVLARTVRMLSSQVDAMTFLQADRRVARLLVTLAAPDGDARTYCGAHEELARLAGVSRVTVSRVLGELARRGWIRTSYRRVELLDYPALAAFAEES